MFEKLSTRTNVILPLIVYPASGRLMWKPSLHSGDACECARMCGCFTKTGENEHCLLLKQDPSGLNISLSMLSVLLRGYKWLRGAVDDVILAINRAESLLDVISAKFISIIRHRSLPGEKRAAAEGITGSAPHTHLCSLFQQTTRNISQKSMYWWIMPCCLYVTMLRQWHKPVP